ncbi:DUF721 domain-containing protein [Patescibacteria group bacterium]|nr:MAG: DUF721 domain-containing protein [Patescibacteria group bacterium]
MQKLSGLLNKYSQFGIQKAVSRALVIESANRWLVQAIPKVRGWAVVKSMVGKTLIVQCRNGLIASEVKLRAPALLNHLAGEFPGFAPLDLKCFLSGSNLGAEEAI